MRDKIAKLTSDQKANLAQLTLQREQLREQLKAVEYNIAALQGALAALEFLAKPDEPAAPEAS